MSSSSGEEAAFVRGNDRIADSPESSPLFDGPTSPNDANDVTSEAALRAFVELYETEIKHRDVLSHYREKSAEEVCNSVDPDQEKEKVLPEIDSNYRKYNILPKVNSSSEKKVLHTERAKIKRRPSGLKYKKKKHKQTKQRKKGRTEEEVRETLIHFTGNCTVLTKKFLHGLQTGLRDSRSKASVERIWWRR